jgi:Heterokaryon incompatibility protein (HET)
MRLINVATMKLEECFGDAIPPYAILSHTWGANEVTFQDITHLSSSDLRSKQGWEKIEYTCQEASRRGIAYAWVDTCCIDKSSSAELSEAINSMYSWYADSTICFAFLADLDAFGLADADMRCCRWFTRGWCLQELLAPENIDFFDKNWKPCGNRILLQDLISSITGIDKAVLLDHRNVSGRFVAERMSWAAKRQTTRAEDMAYCLLGVFDVNMPLLYGEGGAKAFERLQEEIIRQSTDPTLFAWRAKHDLDPLSGEFRGILARAPHEFEEFSPADYQSSEYNYQSSEYNYTKGGMLGCEFTSTNKGVLFRDMAILANVLEGHYIFPLRQSGTMVYGVVFKKVGPRTFLRSRASEFGFISLQAKHRPNGSRFTEVQYCPNESFYVPKHASKNDLLTAKKMLDEAIRFRSGSFIFEHLRYAKVGYGKECWDLATQSFLPVGRYFIGTLTVRRFALRGEWQENAILVCRHSGGQVAVFVDPNGDNWERMDQNIGSSPSWGTLCRQYSKTVGYLIENATASLSKPGSVFCEFGPVQDGMSGHIITIHLPDKSYPTSRGVE